MTAGAMFQQKGVRQCAALQVVDVVTTLLFLARGVAEANPLVKWSIARTHGNFAGLLAVKLLAVVLMVLAVRSGRVKAIARMNRFFTALAGWNLTALAISFARH